ncbi:MAG: hypothetical protein R2704_04965 [Microthrixaceae bacterium]
MTETTTAAATEGSTETTLAELKALVDRGLGGINERQLMPSGEVADLLLDMRMLLAHLEREPQAN